MILAIKQSGKFKTIEGIKKIRGFRKGINSRRTENFFRAVHLCRYRSLYISTIP
jgi:hypothetical protein